MTRKLLSQSEFHDAARAGRAAGVPLYRSAAASPMPIPGMRAFRFRFSDRSIDRMSDTIDPDGWDLTNFLRSPTALFAHDSSAPPIGRAFNLQILAGTALDGSIEFPTADIYPFAAQVFDLIANGYLRSVSVGFIPTKFKYSTDPSRPGGIDFLEQELLEISVVPIPANANALIQAQAKGLSTGALRGIRSGGPSPRIAAELRSWAQETAQPDPEEEMRMARARNLHSGLSKPRPLSPDEPTEAELEAKARRLARSHLGLTADRSTPEGRAQHARRLRAFHDASGGRLVDRRAAEAEAVFRTAARW
jgi:HK97 family phage prohead protease